MTHTIQHPENEGKVATFDTYAEALTAQEHCLTNHLANHNDNPAYTAQTTKWCEPMERIDGKWDIFICHHTDAAGATNISDYDSANYPQPEEE